MTRPIAHLEGRRTYVTGTACEWNRRPEGGWFLLLRKLEVRPFDPSVPILSVDPIAVDHCWFHWDERDAKPLRNTRVGGIAIPYFYARAGGSVDLGLRSIGTLDVETLIELATKDLAEASTPTARMEIYKLLLAKAEDAHRQGRLLLTSSWETTDQAIEALRREVATKQREAEHEMAALLSGAGVKQPTGLQLGLRSAGRSLARGAAHGRRRAGFA